VLQARLTANHAPALFLDALIAFARIVVVCPFRARESRADPIGVAWPVEAVAQIALLLVPDDLIVCCGSAGHFLAPFKANRE
jgi:hypothetical protein